MHAEQTAPRLEAMPSTAIAVTGMACRFAGALDLAAFWTLLQGKHDGLRRPHDEALRAAGVDAASLADPDYMRVNGSLEGALAFDAAAFGFSPEEAALLDPQHRVLLEHCWHALNDAGLDPARDGDVGIYAGVGFNTYLLTHLADSARGATGLERWRIGIGNDKDTATSRVAYKLGLTGPAVTVQTACSTSLVAVHLACQGLLDGDCDVALAGGATLRFPLGHGYRYHAEGIDAADGRCRPFSPSSTGTVFADGVGVVVLRRYEDAVAAGDRIYATILGSAVNNDASRKVGFTAPGVAGQASVVRAAQAAAGVRADEVGYVEAHGTGTALGDRLEIVALDDAFGAATEARCLLGSVKGHIGHADTAAGIAGLIKTALSIHHGIVPPTLVDGEGDDNRVLGDRFIVNASACDWRADAPRLAGVSSFGIGGTNAHVVLGAPPDIVRSPQAAGPLEQQYVMPVSAFDADTLRRHTETIAAYVAQRPADVAGIARMLHARPVAGRHRALVVARRVDDNGTPRIVCDPPVVGGVAGSMAGLPADARAWLDGASSWPTTETQRTTAKASAPGYPFRTPHVEYHGAPSRWSRVAPDDAPRTRSWQTVWTRRPTRRRAGRPPSAILVIAGTSVPARLLAALGSLAPVSVWRHGSDPAAASSGERCFDFDTVEAWEAAWVAYSPPADSVVLYVDTLADVPFEHTLRHAMVFAGTLCAHLPSRGFPSIGVHWLVVGEEGRPSPATWGVARVLPQETPGVRSRWCTVTVADLAGEQTTTMLVDWVAEDVPAERKNDFAACAIRAGKVRVANLQAIDLPEVPAERPAIRTGGLYLVTGGAGGIGRQLAAWLASTWQARVVVCGRRPAHAIDGWDAWVASYPGVTYIPMDVTDEHRWSTLGVGFDNGLHAFDGVFHAAGVAGERSLAAAYRDGPTAITASKVRGALALCEAFHDVALDFVVLFGSVNAWSGGVGQAEYASANAFLDHLARGGQLPWRTVSIGWDTWRGIGMAGTEGGSLPDPGGEGARSRVSLPATAWLLREHRIDGVPVLPGMAHVTLLFRQLASDDRPLDIRDVVFHAPVVHPGDGDLVLTIAADERTGTLSVRDAGERVVCSASVSAGMSSPVPVQPEPGAFDALPSVERVGVVRPPARIELGARWSGVVAVDRADAWFRIALDASACVEDFDRWPFHPALMDLAMLPLQSEAHAFSVPVSVDRITAHRALVAVDHALVHRRQSEELAADVWIMDAAGNALLTMEGVRFRPLPPRAILERMLADGAFEHGLSVDDALEQLRRALDHGDVENLIIGSGDPTEWSARVEARCAAYRSRLVQTLGDESPWLSASEGAGYALATLCAVIAEQLGYPTVSPDDGFFALGGDSLSALLVIDAARAAGIALSMADLYRAATIRELLVARWPDGGTPVAMAAIPFAMLDAAERGALPASAVDGFPLTRLQQGIQYFRARYGASAIYRDVLWAQLEGPFDAARFDDAWSACSARHAVLRTRLIDRGAHRALQWVDGEVGVRVLVQARGERSFDQWLAQVRPQASLPLGPAACPIVVTADASFHVVLVLDDALLDGWSATALMAELLERYAALLDGRSMAAVTPPERTFHDYVRHEEHVASDPVVVAFWRDRVNDATPTALATADDDPGRSPDIAILALPFAAGEAVDELARHHGVSAKIVLLAAHLRMLAAWCGIAEVTTGVETHTRLEGEGAIDVLGLHLNTLPMSFRFSPMSVTAFIAAVREAEAGIMLHRHLPLADIQPPGGIPLFDTCFNYTHFRRLQGVSADDALGSTLRLLAYSGEEKTNYPFKLWVDREATSGVYRLYVAYDRHRLDESRARALGASFDGVVAALADDPSGDILSIGQPAAESSGAWLGEPTSHDDLSALLERAMTQPPGALAVIDGSGAHDYAALVRQVEAIMRSLADGHYAAGSVAGIALPRSLAWVAAMIAVARMQLTMVLFDPNLPAGRLDMVRRLAGTSVVIEATDAAPGWALRRVAQEAMASGDERRPEVGAMPLYLVFTSGSTGEPKAVAGTRHGLANRIDWHLRQQPVGPGDLYLSRTAQSFVDVFFEVIGPLCAGAALAVMSDDACRDPERIARQLVQTGATHMVIVPTLLCALLDELDAQPMADAMALKHVSVSGELLPASLLRRAEAALPGVRWLNIYGSSEVAADVTVFEGRGAALADGAVPVGSPLSNVGLYLLDRNLKPVPEGVEGELYVSGVALANGYLGRPAETAARFLPNPFAPTQGHERLFRTGDLARRGPSGLTIVGRSDRQVKVRGVRVDLDGIEARLESLEGVRRACVAMQGEVPAAWLECDATTPAFWLGLRTRFTSQERPHPIRRLPRMPLTATGKIDRRAVVGLDGTSCHEPGESPCNEVETRLLGVWRQLLPDATLYATSRFDDVGGHSLLLLQLAGAIEREFGQRPSIEQLLAAPTLRDQALSIGTAPAPAMLPWPPMPRTDPTAAFAPTPLQQAYWVARQGNGQGSHFYQEYAIPWLDCDRLARAWGVLGRRHGMLRATLTPEGRLVQGDAPSPATVVDLRPLGPDAAEYTMLAWRDAHAFSAMDTRRGPLCEMRLFRLHEDRAVVVAKIDFIVADAWSIGLLGQELWALYADEETALPPLEIGFQDVLAARALGDDAAIGRARDYWTGRLASLSGPPDVPMQAVTAGGEAVVTRRELHLDASRVDVLASTAKRWAMPTSSLLLAAYAAVLQRWSAQKSFLVTVTTFDRPFVHPHVNRLVGDFTSVVWLEVHDRGPVSFEAFARQVHAQLVADLDHASFSGVELLREARRQGRSMDVGAFVFTHIPDRRGPGPVLPEGTTERYRITRTAGVRIDNQAVGDAGRLRLHWDTWDASFPPGMVDDMFAAYRALVEALTESTPVAIAAREITLDAGTLAQRQGEAPVVRDGDAMDAIARACREHAGRVAVVDGEVTLTYDQLWRRATHLAKRWQASVTEGAAVGIHMDNGWRYVVAVLATQLAGAAYVPLSMQWPRARVCDVLAGYGVSTLVAPVHPDPSDARLDALVVLDVDEVAPDGTEAATGFVIQAPTSLAYVMFTSGSTGEPKGVMMNRRGVANTLFDMVARLRMTPADRVLALSDPGFDLSVFDMLAPLMVGASVVFPGPGAQLDPARWWRCCADHAVTIWNSAPALFDLLAEYAVGKADRIGTVALRWVLLSGDWIPLRTPDQVRRMAPRARLLSLGGATEAGIWSVVWPVASLAPDWTSIPYGRPLRGQSCDVLDTQGRSCPNGVAGELVIEGESLSLGYWQRPGLTQRAFVVDPSTGRRRYRTGDLARYRPDGSLELIGRMDHQVKIRGQRIECGEIEHTLAAVPGTRQVVVMALKGRDGVAQLHAMVEAGQEVSLDAMREHAAARLPERMVPRYWHRLASMPITANGKIDRQSLAAVATTALAPEVVR